MSALVLQYRDRMPLHAEMHMKQWPHEMIRSQWVASKVPCGGNQANGTNTVGAKIFFRKTQLGLALLCAQIPGAQR